MPPLHNILVCYPLRPASLLTKLKQHFAHVDYFPVKGGIDYSDVEPPQPPAEAYERADVLLTFHLPTNLHDVKQMPNLKLLQLVGSASHQVTQSDFVKSASSAGHDSFNIANSAGIHTSCIGEWVLMATMMLFRKMNETNDIMRVQRRWATPQEIGGDDLYVRELRGSTVGIMGYGNLGREIARLFSSFGCRIIVATRSGSPASLSWLPIPGTGDPSGSLPDEWYSTESKEGLHEFMGRSDVVVNCLPVSPQTVGLIGRDEFRAAKARGREAVFVNVGRGSTVVQDDLVDALKDGTLAGAALDVTDPEPLPDGHELFSLPNVVLTPHVSWASPTNFVRAVDVLLRNKEKMETQEEHLPTPFNNIPY